MADNLTIEQRRNTMRAVKSKDSKMEIKFRSALWRKGLRFYKNVENMPGKPDIIFPRRKVVIFLDSCFWHGCPIHLRLPNSNAEYWQIKIETNRNRDIKINAIYREMHWQVMRVWEHELKKNFNSTLLKISEALVQLRNNLEVTQLE